MSGGDETGILVRTLCTRGWKAALLAVLIATCAPAPARVARGDPHGLPELPVVVRPAARLKSPSPVVLGAGACVGGGIGYGACLLAGLRIFPRSLPVWSELSILLASVGLGLGGAAGKRLADDLRIGEREGDTLGMNIAGMAADRFLEWAPREIDRWPSMTLASLPFGLPIESLPCPRIEFGTRDLARSPVAGLRCALAASIFDEEGKLIYRYERAYSSSAEGHPPPEGIGALSEADCTHYFRKEMQNAADSLARGLIRSIQNPEEEMRDTTEVFR